MTRKVEDLTGQKFGRLTVIKRFYPNDKKGAWWLCKCECGNDKVASGSMLRTGIVRSCGCLAHEVRVARGKATKGCVSPNRKDLTGQTFGRLTVLSYSQTIHGRAKWLCECECGNVAEVDATRLLSGKTRSCGCLMQESRGKASIKHGESGTPLFRKWMAMQNRCYTPSMTSYPYYGGRGIKVCEEWHDYATFAEWARAHGYEEDKDLSIDRIDPNGNYEPDNCQIITMFENRSRAHAISQDKINKIRELEQQGLSSVKIAEIVGVSRPTVERYRQRPRQKRNKK